MSVGQDQQRPDTPGPSLPVPTGQDGADDGKSRRRKRGGVRPAGEALPTRTRSYGSMAVGVALVAGCGLAGALYLSQAGDTDPVLALTRPVAKGQTIERSDLHSVEVTGVEQTYAVDELSAVEGMTAKVDLVEGEVLTTPQVTDAPVPESGQAMVGISLEPPIVPNGGLSAGDRVRIVATSGSESNSVSEAEVLADSAQVYDLQADQAQTDRMTVTVIVKDGDADAVSTYAAASRVSLIEIAASDEDEN